MGLVVLYWTFVAATGVYILTHGSLLECRAFLYIAAASVLSALLSILLGQGFASIELGILAIDSVLLVLLVKIVIESDRFWPMWTTAPHLVGILTHFTMLANPEIVPGAYALAQGFWAYPMLLAVCVGARNAKQRAR
jgi:hypothetical protein